MYSNFAFISDPRFDQTQQGFHKCLVTANWMMLLSFITVALSLLIAFAFDQYFSIAAQVSAHLAIIVFAGVFKVGYVLRCVGAHGLGHGSF